MIPDSSIPPVEVEAEDVQAEDAQAEDVQPGSDMQREPGAAEEEQGQYTAAELATGWGKSGNHQPPETGCVPELGLSQWGVAAVQEPINTKLLRVSSSFISVYSPATEEEGERHALVAVVGCSALPTQPGHRTWDQRYSGYISGASVGLGDHIPYLGYSIMLKMNECDFGPR